MAKLSFSKAAFSALIAVRINTHNLTSSYWIAVQGSEGDADQPACRRAQADESEQHRGPAERGSLRPPFPAHRLRADPAVHHLLHCTTRIQCMTKVWFIPRDFQLRLLAPNSAIAHNLGDRMKLFQLQCQKRCRF